MKVVCRCLYATSIVCPDDTAHYAQHLIRAYDICPSISHLFADIITYLLTISSSANSFFVATEKACLNRLKSTSLTILWPYTQ